MPPSKLKILQSNTFTGGLNSDDAEELIPNEVYRSALNIHTISTGGGQRGIITNCKGTTEIVFDLPAGDNVPLGAKEDTERSKFYWLNYNSNGNHGVYMYDMLLNVVTPIIINETDTGGVDILGFQERGLILHIDIVLSPSGNILFYFAADYFKAKKFNVQKALDKSVTGYGMVITAEDINAYKLASIFPPSLTYFTDVTREANYLYGYMFKASVRHWYDDGEKNNWSEFSTVPLPVTGSFTGDPSVSNVNNALLINVETGSSIVTHIEIAIQINSEPFVSVIVLDKDKLGISDSGKYDFTFYNDNSSYSGLDQLAVYRAFSFLPLNPALQSFTKNSMVYGKGLEGSPNVLLDVSTSVSYDTLFVPDGTTNELNDPEFTVVNVNYDYVRVDPVFGIGNEHRRNALVQVTIGHDVKAGNYFQLSAENGESVGKKADHFQENVLATNSDNATSIANTFKQRLVASGRVIGTSEDLPDTDIWTNTVNGFGDVTFSFIWKGKINANFTSFSGVVNPVSIQTLKNGGQSVGTIKSGGGINYGILYWDEDTRRSNVYTDPDMFIRTDFVSQTAGFKKITHELVIKNLPPEWATYYSIVRTKDLTYGNDYIQFLVQKAIESDSVTGTDYVDLIIGSIYTYQQMYPNTIVRYEFAKNDRVRLIRKEDTGAYYPFTEVVVIDWKEVGTSETILNDITTNGTSTVTVAGTTSADNIGRFIVIDDVEREITAAPTPTTYTLDASYGTSLTYNQFQLVDKRGILRIRKPTVTIADNSLIEVYKPTQNVESAQKTFYNFGQKYQILNPGTDLRAHTGNVQNQDPTDPVIIPAIVDISSGTTYVRNRQLPTNNSVPGTQVVIDEIESQSFSDFYISDLNDNGKIAPEDEGQGQIRMGSRLRFSNNYIEGTRINGLNDFDNINREDYNDPNGDIMLLKYREGLLYMFKQLRTLYTPILASIIVDEAGQQVLGTSDKLLNKAQYFAWEGGIGNFPESYASNQTWQYFLSPNSGTDCRIGGDGILPISEQFFLDTAVQGYINNAVKYSSFVFGGFDRENGERILAFERFNEYLYNAGFNSATWELYHADYPVGTEYEIVTQPVHGTAVINGDGNFVYTPDDYGSDQGFTGEDYFYYRWKVPGGEWTAPKKSCGEVTASELPENAPIWYNALLTTPFTRSNCNPGYHGSVVNYEVLALTYSNPYSQADADQQAEDDAALNGQNWADDAANGGTCTLNAPSAFTFTDLTGLDISTLTESDSIVVPADFADYTISISGTGAEYQINSGAWTSAAGFVNAGDSVKIRRTTSASYNTLVSATLTIGGVSDTWNITTQNGAPDPFAFIDVTGKEISTSYTSNTIVPAGYVGSLPISIVDGEYSVNGGAFTSVAGTVAVGSNVAVRRTSSSAYSTAVGTTLTIGTASDTYTITTRAAANVAVNYAMVFGSNPNTNHWNVIERTRAGVTGDVATIASVTSGALAAGTFVEGDTIKVYQGAYTAFEWAPTSKVNLKMDISGVEYYNADVSTQAGTQNTGAYVIAPGVAVIDIISTGSSTAVGYISENLHVVNPIVTLGVLEIDITDNSEAGLGLVDLSPSANVTSDYSFNVLGTAGTLTVVIRNTSGIAFDYTLNGEGGYTHSGTVNASSSVTWADVTKGGVEVIVILA